MVLSADAFVRVLRDVPGGTLAIVDLLLMMIPQVEAFGKCSLCPEGVGLLDMTIVDTQVKQLLQPLEGAVVFEKMCEGSSQTQQKQAAAEKKMRKTEQRLKLQARRTRVRLAVTAANKKAAKTPAAKAIAAEVIKDRFQKVKAGRLSRQAEPASGSIVPHTEVEVLSQNVAQQSLLQHITATEKYLITLDPRQAYKARAQHS